MPAPAMTHILSHVTANIPPQILDLAFRPQKFSTSITQRIISEVVEKQVLLDLNLVGGKPRIITMNTRWLLELDHVEAFGIMGGGLEGSYYFIPPEVREDRNISSILSVGTYVGGYFGGGGVPLDVNSNYGNTVAGMASEMLGTYTMRNMAAMPLATLEGTNVVRFFPDLLTDGIALRVMLEQDSEFLNMNASAIFALRNFCLCATQRYIANNLIVPIDETEVVGGMEIGIVKTIIQDYQQEAKQYDELLMKLKGAMHYDPMAIQRLIYHQL